MYMETHGRQNTSSRNQSSVRRYLSMPTESHSWILAKYGTSPSSEQMQNVVNLEPAFLD
ncbi:unnamed protein product [Periconia digitata]|uniref:Uncharacterized protein n=1 Tax=Periconia digitata TaxID=1303443 RepID=A0A9W4XN21_9PLEO|nr:unnamed protein product [Periconia digitata]